MSYQWAVAHLLHVSPWDQRERLTVPELQQAWDFVDAYNKAHKEK